MEETTEIAEEWLEEEAEMSSWSRRVGVRISLLPTRVLSPPRTRPRRLGGATWTRTKTWTSATWRSSHRDPQAEARRGFRAEDHQDRLEDVHQVDPPEADPLAGEGPLDRAGPAEALLEDPLGNPTAHEEMMTGMPPGDGSSTSARGSKPSSAR